MSALAASLTVTALTLGPNFRTRSSRDAGPRLFVNKTSMPLLAKWPASALPMAPDPIIEWLLMTLPPSGQVFRTFHLVWLGGIRGRLGGPRFWGYRRIARCPHFLSRFLHPPS